MSDIFRNYLIIVGTGLLVAGSALTVLTVFFKRDVRSIWATYRSWLIMIPLVFACIYLGREAVIALVMLLSVAAFYEFARATQLNRDRWMTALVYAAIIATGATALVPDPESDAPGWLNLFLAAPAYAIPLILTVPILRNETKGQLLAVSLAIVAYMYLGWMFAHLAFLANSRHAEGYLLFLFFAIETTDIAAFTFGKLFGRHPLRSQISPRKTWEGSLGALATAMALPWLLAFSFPAGVGTTQKLLIGLIVGVGGQLGDLSISFIKRDLDIKDMGSSIPGHGGILDRVDSLIFTAPLFFHLLKYCQLL